MSFFFLSVFPNPPFSLSSRRWQKTALWEICWEEVWTCLPVRLVSGPSTSCSALCCGAAESRQSPCHRATSFSGRHMHTISALSLSLQKEHSHTLYCHFVHCQPPVLLIHSLLFSLLFSPLCICYFIDVLQSGQYTPISVGTCCHALLWPLLNTVNTWACVSAFL